MDLSKWKRWLSPRGRTGRREFWIQSAVTVGLIVVANGISGLVSTLMGPSFDGILGLLALPITLVGGWILIAVWVKRLRDCNFSGCMIAGVVAVIAIAILVGIGVGILLFLGGISGRGNSAAAERGILFLFAGPAVGALLFVVSGLIPGSQKTESHGTPPSNDDP